MPPNNNRRLTEEQLTRRSDMIVKYLLPYISRAYQHVNAAIEQEDAQVPRSLPNTERLVTTFPDIVSVRYIRAFFDLDKRGETATEVFYKNHLTGGYIKATKTDVKNLLEYSIRFYDPEVPLVNIEKDKDRKYQRILGHAKVVVVEAMRRHLVGGLTVPVKWVTYKQQGMEQYLVNDFLDRVDRNGRHFSRAMNNWASVTVLQNYWNNIRQIFVKNRDILSVEQILASQLTRATRAPPTTASVPTTHSPECVTSVPATSVSTAPAINAPTAVSLDLDPRNFEPEVSRFVNSLLPLTDSSAEDTPTQPEFINHALLRDVDSTEEEDNGDESDGNENDEDDSLV
ncbi:hypothetical protein ABG067_007810, partial [Albugo candida]